MQMPLRFLKSSMTLKLRWQIWGRQIQYILEATPSISFYSTDITLLTVGLLTWRPSTPSTQAELRKSPLLTLYLVKHFHNSSPLFARLAFNKILFFFVFFSGGDMFGGEFGDFGDLGLVGGDFGGGMDDIEVPRAKSITFADEKDISEKSHMQV